MSIAKMTELGARVFGEQTENAAIELRVIEALMPIPATYQEILTEFRGAVVFEGGARFATDEVSPLNDKDGFQDLEIIFGLGRGKHSILHEMERYEEQLPPSFVPIGGAPGGDLICVDKHGAVYLWDHESNVGEGCWRVSPSVDEFFKKLEPDDSARDVGNPDGIVESESYLDF